MADLSLLAGFLGSFASVRLSTWAIRDGRGPFRNVHIGGRHIHHFVPGILLAFVGNEGAQYQLLALGAVLIFAALLNGLTTRRYGGTR